MLTWLKDDIRRMRIILKQVGKGDYTMLHYKIIHNSKVNRKQTVIYNNNSAVIMLETYEIGRNLEKYKNHINRVMQSYLWCMNAIRSGEIIKSYNPKLIDGFEHEIINGNNALLKFEGKPIAQLNLSGGIINSMDLTLRYIYKVARSYIKYADACI